MPPLAATAIRLLPWTLVVVLLVLNVWVLVLSPSKGEVWTNVLVSGKPLALTEKGTESTQESVALTPTLTKTLAQEAPSKKPVTPVQTKAFMVQAGSFVSDTGIETLMTKLRDVGLEPHVESVVEQVMLNSVQAGPYKNLDDAKEDEAKMRAAGMTVKMETSSEGYVIPLSQSPLLGYAVQDLDKARDLGVTTLRMIKVGVDRPVKKVLLGPFLTKDKAKLVHAKAAKLGLAVPIVKEWALSADNSPAPAVEDSQTKATPTGKPAE